jgi:hypothetical protein
MTDVPTAAADLVQANAVPNHPVRVKVDGIVADLEREKTALENEIKDAHVDENAAAERGRVARAELNRVKRLLSAASGRQAPRKTAK